MKRGAGEDKTRRQKGRGRAAHVRRLERGEMNRHGDEQKRRKGMEEGQKVGKATGRRGEEQVEDSWRALIPKYI